MSASGDAVLDFIAGMEAAGVKPVEPIAARLHTGELIRFRCEGDGPGRQNGWAILYLDERPAGAFGNYKANVSEKWKADSGLTLSSEERARLRREWEEAKARREEERVGSEREAAIEAVEMWDRAGLARPEHPYVAKKRLETGDLRQLGDKLLIPMMDASGHIRNLQRIAPDGQKRFLRGGRTAGLFTIVGSFRRCGETCCIGEGYATMAAVHRATGYPCIVAFSAKNIAAVARAWNNARQDLDFIICADDDSHLDRNIGIETAEAVAREIGARVAVPPRPQASEAA